MNNINKNLCIVNDNNNELNQLNNQLKLAETVSKPLSYYSEGNDLHISYISDIHIAHHTENMNLDEDFLFKKIIKNLYKSMWHSKYRSEEDDVEKTGILVFAGDIEASDPILTVKFFVDFLKYADYLNYKALKKTINSIDKLFISENILKHKIIKIKKDINDIKLYLSTYIDFEYIINYKNKYHEYTSWINTINAYKSVKSYIKKNVADKCNYQLDLLALKLDVLDRYTRKHDNLTETINYHEGSGFISNKIFKKLNISDIYKKHILLSDIKRIIFVLGNHEYVNFHSVQNAVEYYKKSLEPLGIKVLHNEYYEFSVCNKNFVIYGGTGFAKYNSMFNAYVLCCCDSFTREIEIEETDKFEKKYKEAQQIAQNKNACLICISHYPAEDCHKEIDNKTIYFYGHNHRNYYCRNEQAIIYADNQIGYKNPDIFFKTMSTGLEINPYFSLEDGLYKTTIKDYLQFYRYIGENIGEGKLLYKRCKNENVGIYIIKRKGYYGFFIVNKNSGSSKGISIVNGGMTKKITNITDLQWLFNNFEIVLYKYLEILTPLRTLQEQLSKEIKELGFRGNIHGCIVDINYSHHIMINPIEKSVTLYFSPFFGSVKKLDSFLEVLLSMKENEDINNNEYDRIQKIYNDRQQKSDYLLGQIKETKLIGHSNITSENVSRSQGMYGISRAVNPLQRLFSGHLLRSFDLQLLNLDKEIEMDSRM